MQYLVSKRLMSMRLQTWIGMSFWGILLCATARSEDIQPKWMSYLGGSDYDYGQAVATDSAGNIYVTGETRNTSDFVGKINVNHGGRDAFVCKLDSDGQIQWSAYIGGTGNDSGLDIVVDSAGIVYIAGNTASSNLDNALNQYQGGTSDAFVAAINSDGSVLWSAYIGGEDTDRGNGIALDPTTGDLIVAGYTESSKLLGRTNVYFGGAFDGFIARLSSQGMIRSSEYIGGAYSDSCESVAVNSAGSIFVVGTSYLSDLPAAVNTRAGANDDAFVASFSATGRLRWSRYIGGSAGDRGYDLAIGHDNAILAIGFTDSKDLTDAVNSPAGLRDVFLVSLTDDGAQNFAQYLGGAGDDIGYGIAVDSFGNSVIVGQTNSTNLPLKTNSALSGQNAFAAAFNSKGTLVFTHYLGGSLDDIGFDAAIDPDGDILATGMTNSYLFPAALNTFRGGTRDGFVTRMPGVDLRYADLVVSIPAETLSAIRGATVSIPLRIENVGAADAIGLGPGFFTTAVYLSESENANWTTAPKMAEFKLAFLPAGDVLNVSVEITAPPKTGRFYLRAQTDILDTVAEQHEQNNAGPVVAMDVTDPPGKPDLRIRRDGSSYTADPGQIVAIPVVVENAGQAEAVASGGQFFLTQFLLASDPNDWTRATPAAESFKHSVLGIGAVATIDFQITAPIQPGRYYLRAQTDVGDVIDESSETNNIGDVLSLTVRTSATLPDLTVGGDATIPLLYRPNEDVPFFVDLANHADANAVPSGTLGITTTLYLANHAGVNWDNVTHVVGQLHSASMDAGEIRYRDTIDFRVPSVAGSYRLRAKVDSLGAVVESDETNNWGPMILLLVDADYLFADLVAAFPDANEMSVKPGQSFEVPVVIHNRGSASAIPQGVNFFDTMMYLASDPAADWANLGAIGQQRLYFLDPDEQRTVRIALTAPEEEGIYYLRAQTDVNQAVTEGNEDNWSAMMQLRVEGTAIRNHPPELQAIGNQSVAEMQTLRLTIAASDPDSDTLTFTAAPLPRRAAWAGNILTWTPDFDQAGSYSITFTVTDGEYTDSETIVITVHNVNRPPILETIGSQDLVETQTLSLTVRAVDPDGDAVMYSIQNLPDGASFVDRLFQWTPREDQAGTYAVTFVASDGQSQHSSSVETILITVRNLNRPPNADAGEDQTLTDSDSDGVAIVVLDGRASSDPDSDPLTFLWSDNLGDSIPAEPNPQVALRVGHHAITLTVQDSGGLASSDIVNVVINPGPVIPHAPVLEPVADATVVEGRRLTIELSATDPDGDAVEYSAVGLPETATLDPRTGVFSWQPWYDDAGTVQITFIATAAGLQDMKSATLTVTDKPLSSWYRRWLIKKAVLSPLDPDSSLFLELSDQQVLENQSLIVLLGPADLSVIYSSDNLPDGARISGNQFSWRPWYDQSGEYSIRLTAQNDKVIQTRSLRIRVINVLLSDYDRRWIDRFDKPDRAGN